MRRFLFFSHRSSKKGSGLVEVLIAVLVIAIGVTATLQLFVTSSKNSKNSYYRLQAQFYIDDLLSRMRGNQLGVSNGYYVFAEAPCSTASSTGGSNPGEKVAKDDLAAWKASISARFGNAFCEVSQDGVNAKKYTVRLGWTEDGTVPNLAECNAQDKSTLCFSVVSLVCTNYEIGGAAYTCS